MIYCGTNGHALAIDEKTGKEVWRTKLRTKFVFNAASSGNVTVILANEILMASCNGHIWGLEPKTGQILWHNDLPGLGNRFITMCTSNVSIQYVHEHTTEHQSTQHRT
jgi:outer membrane protein assembly factor BamB